MRHLTAPSVGTNVRTARDAPSSLGRDSRRHASPRGLRYLECRPGTRASPSSPAVVNNALKAVKQKHTHLESDVVVAYADLELLLADDVFLRPVRVVFSARDNIIRNQHRTSWTEELTL